MVTCSVLVALVTIGTCFVTLVGFVADNASLRAALDGRTLAGLYALLLTVAVLLALFFVDVRHGGIRFVVIAVTAVLALAIAMPTIPRVVAGLTPDARDPGVRVAAPQTVPIRVERGAITGEIHRGQDLRLARVVQSRVDDTDFADANLAESDLRDTALRAVNLSGADLCAVDLRGADLRAAAGLVEVRRWDFSLYDERTRFPPGFDPAARGGLVFVPRDAGLLYSCESGRVRELVADGDRGAG